MRWFRRSLKPCARVGVWCLTVALGSCTVSWPTARALAEPSLQASPDTGPRVSPSTSEHSSSYRAPPAQYEAAIDRAVDEHLRGHFEKAREHFRRAHELYPNARTLRGLGKVEFELRNYGESVKLLQAALSAQERPLSAPLRAEVQTLLERARAYVGAMHVDVQPGTATVTDLGERTSSCVRTRSDAAGPPENGLLFRRALHRASHGAR